METARARFQYVNGSGVPRRCSVAVARFVDHCCGENPQSLAAAGLLADAGVVIIVTINPARIRIRTKVGMNKLLGRGAGRKSSLFWPTWASGRGNFATDATLSSLLTTDVLVGHERQ